MLFTYKELSNIAKLMLRRKIFKSREDYRNYTQFVGLFRHIEEDLPIFIYNGYSYKCSFCGVGGFTARGLYLHIIRKHMDELIAIIEDRIERNTKLSREIPSKWEKIAFI